MTLEQSMTAFVVSLAGRDFEAPSGPLPEGVPAGRGPGFCVADTKAALAADPSLRPVVGRAIPPGESEPVDHVWAVDADGRVFDASWANGGRDYRGVPNSREYLGGSSESRDRPLHGAILA